MNENEIPEHTDLERAQSVQDGRKVDNTCKAYMYKWRKFVYWATEKLRLNEINLLNNEEMTPEGIDNFGGVNLDLILLFSGTSNFEKVSKKIGSRDCGHLTNVQTLCFFQSH